MNKALWLGVAVGGVGLVSGTIYTFMGFTGEVVYDALSHPGRPPMERPPPEIPKVPLPDGPLADLVLRNQTPVLDAVRAHDGPVVNALREHDGPLMRLARAKLGAFSAADADAVAKAAEGVDFETLGDIDLSDPSGRDLAFLLKVVREGTPAQQRSAARAMVEIGHPAFARSILEASATSASPEPLCLSAMALIGSQDDALTQAQLAQLLGDPALPMHEACRRELSEAASSGG